MKITRRQFVQAMAVAGASALLTACGGSSGSTAGSGAAAATGGNFNLKLGHNLAEDHAVHIQLTSFAEQVKEKTNGTVNIQIIPNGTLGSESDMISQIQAGALDMAKVSASTLGNFSEKYNAFSVPYVFDDQAHYYTYMDSDSAQAVFESTDDQGFRGLTWLDSGARSFYTKATAIRTPADLKGLKIRTMDSQKMCIRDRNMSNPNTLTDFVFTADFTDSNLLRYADQGVILNLEDYIDNNMPNLQKVFEQYPEYRTMCTDSEGHIWACLLYTSAPELPALPGCGTVP